MVGYGYTHAKAVTINAAWTLQAPVLTKTGALKRLMQITMDVRLNVSKNNGTPKSSIGIGFSITNHHFGVPYFWKHPFERGENVSLSDSQTGNLAHKQNFPEKQRKRFPERHHELRSTPGHPMDFPNPEHLSNCMLTHRSL